MSRHSVRDTVLELVDEVAPNSSGWVRAHCPYCAALGHVSTVKNLAINPETGWFKCWRSFHCGTKGWLFEKSEQVYSATYAPIMGKNVRDYKEDRIGPKPGDVEGFQRINVEQPGLGLPYFMYARKRRVASKTLSAVGAGFTLQGSMRNRFIVPFLHEGKYVGSVGRTLTGYDYKNSPGFMREAMFNVDALWADTPEPIAIVEGLFDALPHYPYAVACLGKPSDNQVDILGRSKRPLVMFLDADARMENRLTMVRLALRGANVRAAYLPAPHDPGDIPTSTFVDYLLGDAA